MTGRLIDADALIKRLRNDPLFENIDQFGVLGVIEAEPTVDAQAEIDRLNRLGLTWYDTILKLMAMVNGTEPKHGHWNKINPIGIYECSECGQPVMTAAIERYEYCYHCGARMGGGENDKID